MTFFVILCGIRIRRIKTIFGEHITGDFQGGRVIVSLSKECSYPNIPICKNHSLFQGFDVKKVELIFRPKSPKIGSKIGAIILVHLYSKEKTAVIYAIEKLMLNSCVIFAEPDYYMNSHIIPNDRYYKYLWGMQKISAQYAWDYVRDSRDVIVGVIDSGVDYNHPDLIDNMRIALSEESLLNLGAMLNPGVIFDDYRAGDENGHGTHVAGTIGAVGNNIIGVTGVCWNTKIASLKIGNLIFNLAPAIKAIFIANQNNISILNGSWGGTFYSPALECAIENYEGLFVASAGNSSSNNDLFPIFPASFDSPNIISVAAIDRTNKLASYSNYGAASVDLAAPGSDILSTDLSDTYSYMDGTSMAAPHVAGAATLLKAYRPNLTPVELKNIILSSVDINSNLTGKVLTGGTLNLYRMLKLAEKL